MLCARAGLCYSGRILFGWRGDGNEQSTGLYRETETDGDRVKRTETGTLAMLAML